MYVAAPCDVACSGGVVSPPLEGAAALAADDLSGKGVTFLVFFAIR